MNNILKNQFNPP